ncbi:MAG: ABC transporter ATP-binding protein [Acidobacteriota bacterium]
MLKTSTLVNETLLGINDEFVNIPAVSIRNLSKKFAGQTVLCDVSFDIVAGERLVLLGQSGSGKTTIVRCLAGLEQPDSGEIYLGAKCATHLPIQKRNLGIVFQERDLFQRMTVEENIAFGLKLRGVAKRQIQETVDEMLELIRLQGYRTKYPSQLSGGQRQRVAVARALAYKPEVMLFDEAFNALDAVTRVAVRREVRLLLQKMNVPALFITHDQEEALELGDRIAVLNKGRIEQIGTPYELYNYPQSEFVAAFLGAANVLMGRWYNNEVVIDALRLKPPQQSLEFAQQSLEFNQHQPIKIIFRPEDVVLDFQPQLLDVPYYLGRGIVKDLSYIGPYERLVIQLMTWMPQPDGLGNKKRLTVVEDGSLKESTITVTRTKWRAGEMELSVGDQVAVGLKHYRLLSVK